MWSADTQKLSQGNTLKIRICQRLSSMTLGEVLRGWTEDEQFRSFFTDLLAQASFADFRWETPPSTISSLSTPFEFVLVNSPGLAEFPAPSPFADQFSKATTSGVVSFHNLGRDALLIVPSPIVRPEVYRHLGAFLRGAPEQQQQLLWKIVGTEMSRTLGSSPVWLNTAGAGVSWLHVRIDQRPKYYVHVPYRRY